MVQYSTDEWERPLSANIAQNAQSTLGADSLIAESGIALYEGREGVVRLEGHVHPHGWV